MPLGDDSLLHVLGKQFLKLLVAQFLDGLGKYLLIGFVTQIGDETALFGSQKVTGTTDVEVLHGNVYSAAQVAIILNGLQASACVCAERCKRRGKQIAESLLVASSHTSAHLVKVAKPEVLRAVDDDGVGVGDVNTALYDGGADEHVIVVVGEAEDDFLQLLGGHLSVAHHHSGIGHILAHKGFQVGQIGDSVIDKIHLAVAAHFKVYGLGYGLGVEGANLCVYGIAVGRRCLYDAEVAGAHQAELQRARNWGGREGERVHIGAHLAQFFLGADAKLLLLVNDKQAKIVEFYRLSNELVGAYDDVDLALLQFLQNLAGLACAAGAA